MGKKAPDRMQGVNHWFCQYPGNLMLEQEGASVDPVLAGLFGYYLVQVGSIGGQAAAAAAGHIRSRILVAPELPVPPRPGWISARSEWLPVANDSVDVVLMPHTLDFCADPHQTLREVERILIPEGRVVIVGFNPWSLWGLWRLVRYRSTRPPWTGRFIATHRIHDWLSLLGFEVEMTRPVMFRPPLRQRSLMDRLQVLERAGARWWPALSGVYVIQAVKRVSTITPVRPRWKLDRRILTGRAIEPSARTGRG